MNDKFQNACNRAEQSTPPIWMMRQAGRYQKGYMELKESFTFEQMCKLPNVAAKVAMLPINQFDFDIAILFSDILFPIEGLGIPLKFDPGPKFEWLLTEENYKNHMDVEAAIEHMDFQSRAITATLEALPKKKSLIGFVGGPWTLLNYATGKQKTSTKFKVEYLREVIIPLLNRNIHLQLRAGAEKVMILDSGVGNMSEGFFKKEYVNLLHPLIQTDTGYYTQHLNANCLPTLYKMGWAGIGVDSIVDITKTFKKYKDGFIQGNFDEKLLLLPKEECRSHIEDFCNTMQTVDHTGWVCGLGHGITKTTPEENVKMFVDMIRERFK
jgi:uroporphyrinogen decarboxylase